MDEPYFPEMQIVEFGPGVTGPTPELDKNWPDLVALQWCAATVRVRTGLSLTVHEYVNKGRHTYAVSTTGIAFSDRPFNATWDLIIALGDGYAIAKREEQ